MAWSRFPVDSRLRLAGRKALFIPSRCRHSPGEVTHDEAVDEPGFLDLGGMAAAGDHQEPALGQHAGGGPGFLAVDDPVLLAADQQGWLLDVREPVAHTVVLGAPDGVHKPGPPAAVPRLPRVEIHQGRLNAPRVEEDAVDDARDAEAARPVD